MKSDTAFKLFEAGLLIGIILLLSITLLLAFVDVAYVIYVQIITPPLLIVDARGLMELFSLILMLLIGLELIETVKTYFKEEAVHVYRTDCPGRYNRHRAEGSCLGLWQRMRRDEDG